jgi:SH3 domain protein
MHAGPGRNFRILGSINAGTTISLLQVDEDAGYSKIKDDRERTGWVESKFVSNTPSIRVSFEEVSKKLNEQQKGYTTMQKKMNTALRELTESEQQKSLLDQNLSKTLKKNAELEKRLAQQDSKVQIEWFTRGAIVVIASIIIGYLLGLFGRKRRKSNPLM